MSDTTLDPAATAQPASGTAVYSLRGTLIEACAGLLDENDPETAIRKEAEEELGYRLKEVSQMGGIYMSPGSVKERLSFFLAHYSPADRISEGGGSAHEGDGQIAAGGQHLRGGTTPHLAPIFVKDDIADVMGTVLNPPMAA